MLDLIFATITQSMTFLLLAVGITISYRLLKATDLTLDGSFVLGAGLFAHLISVGVPALIAVGCALIAGSMAGVMVSLIQYKGRVDSLLAGVLATFILASVNLLVMGKPNISLLSSPTLFSPAFAKSEFIGWSSVAVFCGFFCFVSYKLISSRFGLVLRALGDNQELLLRLGKSVEFYRMSGFALTNGLAALAGVVTAQIVGYADLGMGFGMTLTGIGSIILGQQILSMFLTSNLVRFPLEFLACLLGVCIYFFSINTLLKFDINPIYIKMLLGILLVIFLRGFSLCTPSSN